MQPPATKWACWSIHPQKPYTNSYQSSKNRVTFPEKRSEKYLESILGPFSDRTTPGLVSRGFHKSIAHSIQDWKHHCDEKSFLAGPQLGVFLMFPHGPHDEFRQNAPKKQSAIPNGSQIRTDLKPSKPWFFCNVFSHANVANSGNYLPAAIRSYPRLKYGWIFRVFSNLGDPSKIFKNHILSALSSTLMLWKKLIN